MRLLYTLSRDVSPVMCYVPMMHIWCHRRWCCLRLAPGPLRGLIELYDIIRFRRKKPLSEFCSRDTYVVLFQGLLKIKICENLRENNRISYHTDSSNILAIIVSENDEANKYQSKAESNVVHHCTKNHVAAACSALVDPEYRRRPDQAIFHVLKCPKECAWIACNFVISSLSIA